MTFAIHVSASPDGKCVIKHPFGTATGWCHKRSQRRWGQRRLQKS